MIARSTLDFLDRLTTQQKFHILETQQIIAQKINGKNNKKKIAGWYIIKFAVNSKHIEYGPGCKGLPKD